MFFSARENSQSLKSILSRNPIILDSRFKQEITRLFYKQVPFISISLFFVLAVTYYSFKTIIPDVILTPWIVVNLAFSIILLLIYFAYQRRADERNSSFWLNIYIALLLLQDISLGMLGPMSTLVSDELSQFFILFLLAGMAAGSIATRGIRFEIYILCVSALLLPVALTHAVMEHELSATLLILTIVFYVFMLFVGKNYSDTISSNISLWLNLEEEIETRKHTEVELLRAKQVAETANETKNQFLANVSHELRTPLNGIIGFSTALNKCKLDSSTANYVDQIGRCSRNLLSMVNDVLDISTIEAGKLKLHKYPFNLSHEMGEVAALAQRLSEDKGLRFEYHMATDLPHHLIGDAQRIKQVINNLLNNAIKYTEQGFIRLNIELSPTNDEKPQLLFCIEDSGIGIPQSAHTTLFNSFTQANNFNSKQHEGVGLGLSIVSNLLQQMHGGINFESEEGKGSRFEVKLPFEISTTTPDITNDNVPTGADDNPGMFNQLNVLIVDDNEVNRLVLKTFLDPYHVQYCEAANGTEALQQLETGEFNIVLLDINMPDLSGFEVRERFCHTGKPCPRFIAVTAHAFEEEIDHILDAGFDECLIKPIAEDELIGMLKRLSAAL